MDGDDVNLVAEVKRLREILDLLNERLNRIEAALDKDQQKTPLEVPSATQQPVRAPSQPVSPPKQPLPAWKQVSTKKQLDLITDEKPKPKKEAPRSMEHLEMDLGKKIFSILGVLSIFLGMVFLVIFSWSRNFLGPIGKVAVGVFVGLLFLVVGDLLDRKKYTWFSRAMTGGGFGILYLIVYTAGGTFMLIPESLSTVLLAVVSICGVFFSLRYNSPLIAAEAFFLGYAVPFIGGVTTYSLLYAAVLSAFLIGVSYRKDWLYLGTGGVIITYVMLWSWVFKNSLWWDFKETPASFNIAVVFSTVYMLLYNLMSVLSCKSKGSLQKRFGGSLIAVINAVLFYSVTYLLMNTYHPNYLAAFTLALGALYLALSSIASQTGGRNLFLTYLVASFTLITIAIPLQLDYHLVTISWAAEAVIMMVLGIRKKHDALRAYGTGVGAITALKTIFIDSFLEGGMASSMVFLSPRVFSYLASIMAFFVIAWAYQSFQEKSKKELQLQHLNFVGALSLLCLLILIEAKGSTTTVLWSLLGCFLAGWSLHHYRSGVHEKDGEVDVSRYFANLLFLVLMLKLISFDSSGLKSPYWTSNSEVSAYTLAFIVAIGAFLAVSVIYKSLAKLPYKGERLYHLYLLAAVFLMFWFLGIKLEGAWVSVAWSILALTVIGYGFAYVDKVARTAGIIILLVTVLKVFIYDLSKLDVIYRVLSFMVLGVILLLTSFAYSRFAKKTTGVA